MKRIAIMIPALAAAFLINVAPSLSEEGTAMGGGKNIGAQKDECLLVAMNCPNQQDTYQQRIERLQKEINKGTDVYTPGELKKLNDELEETQNDLYEMMNEH